MKTTPFIAILNMNNRRVLIRKYSGSVCCSSRAVRQLYLCQINKLKTLQKPSKTSLLTSIWPSLKHLIDQPGYQVTCLDNSGDESHSDNKAPALKVHLRLPLQFNPVTMPDMMTLGVSHRNTSIARMIV